MSHSAFVSENLKAIKESLSKPPTDRERADLQLLERVLAGVKFFVSLDDAVQRNLCRLLGYAAIGEGQDVFRQGAPGELFYVILRGTVDIIVEENGKETCVAEMTNGQSFGEVALISDSLRTSTVRCREETHFLTLTKPDYERTIRSMKLHQIARDATYFRTLFPILKTAKMSDVAILCNIFTTKKFAKGDVIVFQGQPLEHLYFILKGTVERTMKIQAVKLTRVRGLYARKTDYDARAGPDGRRVAKTLDLGKMAAGDCAGIPEYYCKNWRQHAATVVALEDTEVTFIECFLWSQQLPKKVLKEQEGVSALRAEKLRKGMREALFALSKRGWFPIEPIRLPILFPCQPEDEPDGTLDPGTLLAQELESEEAAIAASKTVQKTPRVQQQFLPSESKFDLQVPGVWTHIGKHKLFLPLPQAPAASLGALPAIDPSNLRKAKIALAAQQHTEIFDISPRGRPSGRCASEPPTPRSLQQAPKEAQLTPRQRTLLAHRSAITAATAATGSAKGGHKVGQWQSPVGVRRVEQMLEAATRLQRCVAARETVGFLGRRLFGEGGVPTTAAPTVSPRSWKVSRASATASVELGPWSGNGSVQTEAEQDLGESLASAALAQAPGATLGDGRMAGSGGSAEDRSHSGHEGAGRTRRHRWPAGRGQGGGACAGHADAAASACAAPPAATPSNPPLGVVRYGSTLSATTLSDGGVRYASAGSSTAQSEGRVEGWDGGDGGGDGSDGGGSVADSPP
mmetsp:Transcript_4289/g.10184  ORF Transcript_4289/g.10184 Transcript_4289/m.10184 type:complete len:743 (+) Transcript_4289:302-2530(+)